MKDFNYYVAVYNEENKMSETMDMIREDALCDIIKVLEDMTDYEVVEIFEELGYDIHSIVDLDDEFSHLTVTEILDGALEGIDTSDAWFTTDDARSSDDPWDLINWCSAEIAEEIMDRENDCDVIEIGNILEEYVDIENRLMVYEDEVKEKTKKEQRARELFEKMLSENVDEVISRLWN